MLFLRELLLFYILSTLQATTAFPAERHAEKQRSNGVKRMPHVQRSDCSSLSSFCTDFVKACMSSCIDQHNPHGFSKRTPVSYKCDARGLGFYDFGCRCNEQDLTGTILDTVASLPHKSTTTVTVTQTQTKTVATRVRTQTATVDITSIAKITGPTIFTSVPVTTDVTSVVTTLTFTSITTLETTSTTTRFSVTAIGTALPPPHKRSEEGASIEARSSGGQFCNAYRSSCSSLCGSRSVLINTCSSTFSDVFLLVCVCKNHRDETAAALYPVDQVCGASPQVSTKTVTVTITDKVTAFPTKTINQTDVVVATSVVGGPVVTVSVPIAVLVPETTSTTVVATTTLVIPYTTLSLVSPTGKIACGGGGYVSNHWGDVAGFFVVDDVSNALAVILAEAANDGSVYVYPINGPQTHPYLGATFGFSESPTDPPNLSTSSQDYAGFTLVDYAARGPATTIGSAWVDNGGAHHPSEAVVFKFDPSTLVLSPTWIQTGSSVYAASGKYQISVPDFLYMDGGDPNDNLGYAFVTFTFEPGP